MTDEKSLTVSLGATVSWRVNAGPLITGVARPESRF